MYRCGDQCTRTHHAWSVSVRHKRMMVHMSEVGDGETHATMNPFAEDTRIVMTMKAVCWALESKVCSDL